MLWKVACDGSILSSPLFNSNSSAVLCATLQGEFLAVELVSSFYFVRNDIFSWLLDIQAFWILVSHWSIRGV